MFGTVFLSVVAIFVAFAVFLFAGSDPSTVTLDQDIASIRAEVNVATADSAKYTGGLIKNLIDIRAEVLRTTEAMLNAKRISTLRRIDMQFFVDGHTIKPASESELSKIRNDIAEAGRRISAAELKTQQYTGGLVQGLAIVTAETERLSLAQLYMAYYSSKYGLAAPRSGPAISTEGTPEPSPGTIVKDKDAL
jgi:hypothetical protein